MEENLDMHFIKENFRGFETRGHICYSEGSSGAKYRWESENTGQASNKKRLTISGAQWEQVEIEKTDTGFELSFRGNFESQELCDFLSELKNQKQT